MEPEVAGEEQLFERPATVVTIGGKEYDLAGAKEEARKKGVKYFWMVFPKPKACEKCQELGGKIFYDKPDRPHPNCKCEMIKIEVKEKPKQKKTKKIYGMLQGYHDSNIQYLKAIGPVTIRGIGLGPFLWSGIRINTNVAGNKDLFVPPGRTDEKIFTPNLNELLDWRIWLLFDGADNNTATYEIIYTTLE